MIDSKNFKVTRYSDDIRETLHELKDVSFFNKANLTHLENFINAVQFTKIGNLKSCYIQVYDITFKVLPNMTEQDIKTLFDIYKIPYQKLR